MQTFLPPQKCILVAIVLLGLSSCGKEESANSALKARARIGTFMSLMGGRSSCKQDPQGNFSPYAMDNYPQFKRIVDALTSQGTLVHFFIGCYRGSNTVHHVTSAVPEFIESGSADSARIQMTQLVTSLQPAKTYVMGHSYGGWLAMRMALGLAQDENTVAGFYTIDPISPVTCTFVRPEGCTAAPSDISDIERDQLARKSTTWTNFFQTSTFYLHSSPMRQADENLEIAAEHTAIDTDGSVWAKIESEIN